ncbi:MAG: hypothetical protein IPM76_03170 [Chloroflexi bacterium]|nr:hypothetical protein [Chloroflexota bacterium]
MPFTILRPTAFMESHAYGVIGKSILETGKVQLFGPGENPRNFVAAADEAYFSVRALLDPDLAGEVLKVAAQKT